VHEVDDRHGRGHRLGAGQYQGERSRYRSRENRGSQGRRGRGPRGAA
jgi:hypothetical protein